MNNSKLTLSDVIIEYQENGKYFDKGRIIFGLYDHRLTMFDQQSEIEKVNLQRNSLYSFNNDIISSKRLGQ